MTVCPRDSFAERVVGYSAMFAFMVILWENSERFGQKWIRLAIALSTPLFLWFAVLVVCWCVLFFKRGFGWVLDLASRRGWFLWMSLAVFGLFAVAGRLLYALGIEPVRIAYTGGIVMIVIAPLIYAVGERIRSFIR